MIEASEYIAALALRPLEKALTGTQSPPWIVGTATALLLATPITTALSRNAAFPLLLACMLLLALHAALQRGGRQALADAARRSMPLNLKAPAGAIALASVLFALASLLWSPGFERGFGALTQTSLAALASVFCCLLIARHTTVPAWLAWALPLAIAAGCMLIVSELTFGSPIRGALGASQESFRLNRAAVSVALMLPLLFLVKNAGNRLFVNLAVVALVWVTAFTSISESAKLAVVVVTGTLVLATFVRSKWLVLFCGLGVLATHILAPFLATAFYTLVPRDAFEAVSIALGQHNAHFIRVEIWFAYAQQVLDAPLFGHGLASSLSLWAIDAYTGSDPVILHALKNYGHPHNISIQVWYELGLVGVAFSTALIVVLLRYVLLLPERQQGVAAALMAGVWTVAYVSHGAWQNWWWALVGIIVILFVAQKKRQDQARTV